MSLSSQLRIFLGGVKVTLSNGLRAIKKIPVIDMIRHNWHLGLTSFGGPTVHFQIFRKRFVDKYQWIDEQAYQEMFALCQAMSGPGSTKMLYAINMLRYGFWSGLLAFVIWSLPMAIVAYGLSVLVARIGETLPPPTYALLSGLNSATVGIIALAAVQLSERAITDTLSLVLVFLGGTAGSLYNSLWYFPVLMACGGAAAVLHDLRILPKVSRALKATIIPHSVEDQTPSLMTNSRMVTISSILPAVEAPQRDEQVDPEDQEDAMQSPTRQPRLVSSLRLSILILSLFFATFIVMMVLRATQNGKSRSFDLFANLYLAGTIIFGGGPVVVPLLRAYVVNEGWVSTRDFLLGIALTQVLPGPNFNIVGGLIAYIAIFAPGLILYTGMMGLWSFARKNHAVKACLRGIHATAIGLVYTAVYRLFEMGYLDSKSQSGNSLSQDPWWVVIVATAYIGGKYFKLSPPLAIVLGGVMGLIWYGVVKPENNLV